jgi:hypothetical protein
MSTFSDTRKCSRCKSNGPFYRNKNTKDGLNSICVSCKIEQQRINKGATKRESNIINGVRYCTICGKSDGPFAKTKARSPDGLNSRCNPCRNAEAVKSFATVGRAAYLLRTYGLTLQAYENLLKSQKGKCKLCGADDPGCGWKSFAVDHDHSCCPGSKTCGKCIRALLCSRCNLGLGFVERMTLGKVAEYLEHYNRIN